MLSASLFISLPGRFYSDPRLWKAILRLPYAIFCMCIALLRVNKTKASFLPTPHKTKEVSTLLNN